MRGWGNSYFSACAWFDSENKYEGPRNESSISERKPMEVFDIIFSLQSIEADSL